MVYRDMEGRWAWAVGLSRGAGRGPEGVEGGHHEACSLRVLRLFGKGGFVGSFSRPAMGQGAQSPAEECLELRNEGVAAEGSSAAGAQADPLEQVVLVGLVEDAAPFAEVHVVVPGSEVEQPGGIGRAAMGGGTAPSPFPGLGAKSSADGIALDIGERPPEVDIIQRAGVETVLPEVAAAAVQAVDVLSVQLVRPLEGVGQGAFLLWGDHEMDMIGHEAIALDA